MTNEIDLAAFTKDFFGNIARFNQQTVQREEEIKRQYEHEDGFSKWLDKKGYKREVVIKKEVNNENVHP